MTLHMNKLESPPLKDVLCQVWLKLAQWPWRRRFLNIFNIILLFFYYLSLEKSVDFHLNKHEFPLFKDVPRFVEIGPVVLEKKKTLNLFWYLLLLFCQLFHCSCQLPS